MPKDIHKTIENRLRSIAYKINEMISWSINDMLMTKKGEHPIQKFMK